MDVTSAMRRAATFFADREAIVHGKDRLTFAGAWQRGCGLANGLTPLRSCGLIMPFVDVEIWDENNQPVPTGPAWPDRRPHRRADDRLLE